MPKPKPNELAALMLHLQDVLINNSDGTFSYPKGMNDTSVAKSLDGVSMNSVYYWRKNAFGPFPESQMRGSYLKDRVETLEEALKTLTARVQVLERARSQPSSTKPKPYSREEADDDRPNKGNYPSNMD